jgi:hypothetical protein
MHLICPNRRNLIELVQLPAHWRSTQLTGDAGLLPLRQFDEGIGLTEQFANALDDPRDGSTTMGDSAKKSKTPSQAPCILTIGLRSRRIYLSIQQVRRKRRPFCLREMNNPG